MGSARAGLAVALVVALGSGCGESPRGGFDVDSGTGGDAAGDATMTRTCRAHADCDDRIPCTRDTCVVGGLCEHTPDNGMCTAPQVCVVGRGCGVPGQRSCAGPADCDDRIPCTRDTCLVEGVCRNEPQDGMCPTGQRCDPARGCATGMTMMTGMCTTAMDCNDTYECTEDQCGVDRRCVFVPQNARCRAGQVCRVGMGCIAERPCSSNADCDDRMACNGMERCSELACIAGTAMDCDDRNPCTVDTCMEPMGRCQHAMSPMCVAMARSGIFDVMMPITWMCTDLLGTMAGAEEIRNFQFVVSGGMLTVTGRPMGHAMTGPFTTGRADFDVSITVPGGCSETYRLQGRFTDANRFTGTYSIAFAGPQCAVFFPSCMNRSWPVVGTARAM